MKRIYTVGHSTRSIEDFLELLKLNKIKILSDVRTIPKSARNPQFHEKNLEKVLPKIGIEYIQFPKLGGLRKAKKDSINAGWRNASFRGYADYMQTKEFEEGLEELQKIARKYRTAIMCAEAVPWRCHRSLISDALKAKKWKVLHIAGKSEPKEHEFTSFMKIKNGRIIYPKPGESAKLNLWDTNK